MSAARWNVAFWIIVLSVAACKLVLAYTTTGTNDVLFFQAYAQKLQTSGGVALYQDGIDLLDAEGGPRHHEGFAHPPLTQHLLTFLIWLVAATGVSFPFAFRLLSIAADVGSAVLIRRMTKSSKGLAKPTLRACIFAVAPPLIFLSGFHGNTDPVMLFFLVLTVYWITLRRAIALAGLAFGVSCGIKVWPLLLAPTILLYIPGVRRRLLFTGAAAAIALVYSAPVLYRDPSLVIHRLSEYASISGQWGFSRLFAPGAANAAWDAPNPAPPGVYDQYGRHLLIVAAIAIAFWMHRKSKAPLTIRVGTVAATFLTFTPGFGIQYLSWLLPWLVFLDIETFLIYLTSTTVFTFHVYTYWSMGFPWRLADSTVMAPWSGYMVWFEFVAWLAVTFCFAMFCRAAAERVDPDQRVAGYSQPPAPRPVPKRARRHSGPARAGVQA
jgi:hypothetical protein